MHLYHLKVLPHINADLIVEFPEDLHRLPELAYSRERCFDPSNSVMVGFIVGDRVCWGVTRTDLGTVVGASWSGVTIDWDDGHTTSIQHNDMAQVERVPVKLM